MCILIGSLNYTDVLALCFSLQVFLQLAQGNTEAGAEDKLLSISETLSDTGSIDSFPVDPSGQFAGFKDNISKSTHFYLAN